MNDADLELHIDEVVAEGLSEREARGLASAIEHHLGLIVERRGLPLSVTSRHLDQVDLEAPRAHRQSGDAIAERVAHQVHGALTGVVK